MVINKPQWEEIDPPPPYDDDEDYDLYLYIPSISSRLIPVEGAPEISLEVDSHVALDPQSFSNVLPTYQSSSSDAGTQTVGGSGDESDAELPSLHVCYSSR